MSAACCSADRYPATCSASLWCSSLITHPPVRIIQRADGLLLAVHSGRNCGDDACLGAPTQGVAQQAGELGVTVGHVARVLHQGCDHTAQSEQTLVDGASLTCAAVLGTRPAGR